MLKTSTLKKQKTLFAIVIVLTTLQLKSQTSWAIDPTHGHMGFSLQYMSLGDYSGAFKSYYGKINSKSETDFTDAVFNIEIDMNSVNAEEEGHEEILKDKDYFDIKKYPFATFRSISMKPAAIKGTYDLEGELIIKNISRKIKFQVVGAPKPITNPYFNTTNYGLSLSGSIKRSDFNVGTSEKMDNGGLILGDEIKLFFTLILIKSNNIIPMAKLNAINVDEAVLTQYVGQYDYGNGSIFSIIKDKDKLFAIGKSRPKEQIFPLSDNKFFLEFKDFYCEFIKGADNKVVKVINTNATGDVKYEGQKISDIPESK
jgi:polyisoprenoid-binding protein YceI